MPIADRSPAELWFAAVLQRDMFRPDGRTRVIRAMRLADGSSLGDGLLRAVFLSTGRSSEAVRLRQEKHWAALTIETIRAAGRDDIERLLLLIGGRALRGPWSLPSRGARGGTRWEWVNVEARNRLSRIAREEDRDAIPDGANMVAASSDVLDI